MYKIINYIFLFFIPVILPGCFTILEQSSGTPDASLNVNRSLPRSRFDSTEIYKEYFNPEFKYAEMEFTRSIYPEKIFPESTNPFSIIEFKKFISGIRLTFSKSNLTKVEAEKIYSILEKMDYHDAPIYGIDPKDPNFIFDVRKRISIRKITNYIYDIAYIIGGCGSGIEHIRVRIINYEIVHQEPIEKWIVHQPC